MEFRVLGPLEVVVDGRALAVGGPKPRALLASLLLRPGSVVSTDRLVDAVWPGGAPRNATGALRAYVSRLRAALPPVAGGERLRYLSPGYVLTVGDGELDAAEFVRLVDEGRGLAAAAAVEVLDRALGLWRGEVLEDLDVGALDASAELARLADLRLVAVQERAEAMLRLGRGREVVTELEELVRRFPDREQLAVLSMRALYEAGRQSEALAVYRDLRGRLVDELGVEPSPETREAHRRLLAQDRASGRTMRAAPDLPHRRTSFVGRDWDLDRVAQLLRNAPVVTLTGVGGVGKSRFALEVARREQARFPHGVWLCELAPLAGGGPVTHTVAAALRVTQRQGLTLEQTLLDHLRGRRLLLVLDNCEHLLDAASRLVATIVSTCPDVTVLATSREPLGIADEQVWPLRPLPDGEAATLFVDRARAHRPDFRPGPAREPVAEICRRLDGLPLAIELAAARMRVMSAAELVTRLDDPALLTLAPRGAEARHRSLTAAIDWSYRLLAPAERLVFVRMSVFAGSADLAAVHAVCAEPGTTEADTLDLLTALVDKSMVVATESPLGTRYLVLETLKAFGRDHRDGDTSHTDDAARRHAEHFVGLAQQVARGVQGPDERVWVQRTLPEIDNLRAAFDWAMAAGEIDLAVRLATALPELSRLRLGYESMEWAERALAVTPRDHPLFAATVGAAARGAWNLGDFAKARRLAALAGDRSPGRGAARIGYPRDVQADVALYEDDAAAALSYYREQVAIARRDGDPIRLVWTLYYVAICHAVLRRPDMGLDAARESVRVAATTANPTAESMARYALGLVLKKADPPRALALFDEAAARAESVHNAWWQGIALMEAAATRTVHGDPAVAAAELVVVLDLWEHAGDITQQWLTLRYVVRLLTALGADSDARVLHHALLAAGRPSPLTAEQVATSGGNGVGGGMPVDAALAHARASLRRWFLDHDHRL